MQSISSFQNEYKYTPLSLFSLDETNIKTAKCELRKHKGKASNAYEEGIDIKLAPDSLIYQGKQEKPKLLVCITMYNEPYSQLIESLAGIYRSYYEL